MVKPQVSNARDTFLYLLVVVVLVASTIAMGSLLFDLVNVYLPDAANTVCAYDHCAGAIRIELSFLVIAFGVLVWAWRFIRRDVKANPEKAHLRIRKWLLYFTLFVAGVVLMGDLVSVVYYWLGGELTRAFLLKVASVLLIAGATFYYFLRELHPERPGRQALVGWVSIGAVIVALVSGYMTAGSPTLARDQRLDQQRVSDLQTLEYQVINYWQSKGALPATLAKLRDGTIGGYVPPNDPLSGLPYEYRPTGSRSYELCATFAQASQANANPPRAVPVPMGGGVSGQVSPWDHAAGHKCFEGSIDPQRYPPVPVTK